MMKAVCSFLFSLFTLVISASVACAAELQVVNHIPERYALLMITGVEPDSPLDKEAIENLFEEKFKEADVEQMQLAIYNQGSKPGDGVRAVGEKRKDKNVKVADFVEIPEKAIPILGKFYEEGLGYDPGQGIKGLKKIWNAYNDNEVVADEDFKDKPIFLKELTVPSVSKDAFGKPYIDWDIEKYGLGGVHVSLDKNDPFLRKIKKGSVVCIKAYTKGFVMQSVMMDGYIVMANDMLLIDGKAMSQDDIEELAKSIKSKEK